VNGRERALAAIQLEEPDRLPIFELAIAPSVSKNMLGRVPLYSNEPLILKMRSEGVPRERIEERIVDDVIDLFHKRLKHDIIGAGISESSAGAGLPGLFKGYSTFMAFNASSIEQLGENRWYIDGHKFRYIPETNLVLPDPPITSTAEEVERYIKEHRDAIGQISEKDLYQEKRIINALRDKALILGVIGDLGTFHTWEINHLLPWVYTHLDTVERFVQFEARCCAEVAKFKIDMGVDVCFVDCDWGYTHGPFMSPTHFRKIWYPALRSVVDAVHRKGGFILLHSDGNINPLLEDIAKAGVDGLHSLQPTAGMNIAAVKDKFGDRISLWGNIEISYPLTFGTVKETIEATQNCINGASPGGGHVMCSTNCINQNVKLDNYMAMMDLTRRHGVYPLMTRTKLSLGN